MGCRLISCSCLILILVSAVSIVKVFVGVCHACHVSYMTCFGVAQLQGGSPPRRRGWYRETKSGRACFWLRQAFGSGLPGCNIILCTLFVYVVMRTWDRLFLMFFFPEARLMKASVWASSAAFARICPHTSKTWDIRFLSIRIETSIGLPCLVPRTEKNINAQARSCTHTHTHRCACA